MGSETCNGFIKSEKIELLLIWDKTYKFYRSDMKDYLACVQEKKPPSMRFMAMRKPCMSIPTYTSKLMHCVATTA